MGLKPKRKTRVATAQPTAELGGDAAEEGRASTDTEVPGRKRVREDALPGAVGNLDPVDRAMFATNGVVFVVDLNALVSTIVKSAFEGVVRAEHGFHFTRALVRFADRKALKAAFHKENAAWHGCPLVPKLPQGTFQPGQRVYEPTECFINLGMGKAHVARMLSKAVSPAAVHGRFNSSANALEVLFSSAAEAQAAFAAGPVTVLGDVLLTPMTTHLVPMTRTLATPQSTPASGKGPDRQKSGESLPGPGKAPGRAKKGKKPKKRHSQRHQRRGKK